MALQSKKMPPRTRSPTTTPTTAPTIAPVFELELELEGFVVVTVGLLIIMPSCPRAELGLWVAPATLFAAVPVCTVPAESGAFERIVTTNSVPVAFVSVVTLMVVCRSEAISDATIIAFLTASTCAGLKLPDTVNVTIWP